MVLLVDLPEPDVSALSAALAAEGLESEALAADRVAARSVVLDPAAVVLAVADGQARGWTAIAGLKGNADTRGVPVLAVAADAHAEEAAMAAGADGVLPAATDRGLLVRAIHRLAQGFGRRRR